LTPPSSNQAHQPALIGVDWGTTSCRAYLIDRVGQVIDAVGNDQGILHVKNHAFAEVLDGMIGSWRRPDLPIILSGMIGSRQGWTEVPYLNMPTSVDQIAAGMTCHPEDPLIYLVPGLAQDLPEQAPDVIRGEETQIIGAVSETPSRQLLVMPGTHSKWVLIDNRQIVWFATFMTGELFAALKDHSILGRLMATDTERAPRSAFEQGLDAHHSLPGGLLQQLFSARTLGLFERLPADAIASYLSGLLIGHEIEEALGNLQERFDHSSILVIGTSALADRYGKALAHVGFETSKTVDDVAARGHYQLAKKAGLL